MGSSKFRDLVGVVKICIGCKVGFRLGLAKLGNMPKFVTQLTYIFCCSVATLIKTIIEVSTIVIS